MMNCKNTAERAQSQWTGRSPTWSMTPSTHWSPVEPLHKAENYIRPYMKVWATVYDTLWSLACLSNLSLCFHRAIYMHSVTGLKPYRLQSHSHVLSPAAELIHMLVCSAISVQSWDLNLSYIQSVYYRLTCL